MPERELPYDLPRGYHLSQIDGRPVVQCVVCKRRWWADRMTHWANEVFLVEHAAGHKPMRRKRPGRDAWLPRNLPTQQADA